MLKIHPGFEAIAILTGPAALIIGYHNLSSYLSPPRPYSAEIVGIIHQTAPKCSAPSESQSLRCDENVQHLSRCGDPAHNVIAVRLPRC
jgi:hypothetical protein